MVLNNYLAMQWIAENQARPLDDAVLRELHAVITQEAFDGPSGFEGRFRDGPVAVRNDATEEIVYEAPPHERVPEYLRLMRNWLERTAKESFLHPVVAASVLHFYTVYVHPFYDGNGRSARALFYHHLLRSGYTSFRYLSISSSIVGKREQYYKAIRRCEDERDLTPFVLFSCDIVREAIEGVRARLGREVAGIRLEQRLSDRGLHLNERQHALVRRLVKKLGQRVTVREHERSAGVAYETARQDVYSLVEAGVLQQVSKRKKEVVYAIREAFLL
jgi:Fic family protein